MALSDTFVRTVKPQLKAKRYSDERALYLEVSPAGGKLWRMKYRYAGREKRLSFGVYPDVSLRDARERRDEARKLLAKGIDPGVHKRATKLASVQRAGNTFESVALDFLARRTKWAPSHKTRIDRMLRRDVFTKIGRRPIAELSAPEVLDALRKIEERAPETANRALGILGQIFRYGVSSHKCATDPTVNLRGALTRPEGGHFAAVLDPKQLGQILRAFDGYDGTPVVSGALRLAPLFFVRPGELRRAEWNDFDFDAKEWRYSVGKTKKSGVRDHIVPLSRQAVLALEELKPVTGNGRYVFPSARGANRPMSDNAVLAAMRRMGIPADEMSGHGFRAVARTMLDENLGFRVDVIELQLAHKVRDSNGEAYNRTKHLPERHKMMQAWADYLDSLREKGAEVIAFPQSA